MSLGLATTSCFCTACGWTGTRSPRHIAKPCPNCHQRSVIIPEGEDRAGARVMAIAVATMMAIAAVVALTLSRAA